MMFDGIIARITPSLSLNIVANFRPCDRDLTICFPQKLRNLLARLMKLTKKIGFPEQRPCARWFEGKANECLTHHSQAGFLFFYFFFFFFFCAPLFFFLIKYFFFF